MNTKAWYIENTNELETALNKIKKNFPCFIFRELVEMDFSKIEIKARAEDFRAIETILAPLM
jgi:hypothetical protein